MRIFVLLLSILTFAFTNCNQFELEKDESLELYTYNGANYLSVYSKDFDTSFALFCPTNSSVFAKRLIQEISTRNTATFQNALQVHLSNNDMDIKKIQISSVGNRGFLEDLSWMSGDKKITADRNGNALFLTFGAQTNSDTLEVIKSDSTQSSLGGRIALGSGFECSPNYFKQTLSEEALAFAQKPINATSILSAIAQLSLKNKDRDNTKLLKWFRDCNKWMRLVRRKHSESLENLDYQILTQSTKLNIKTQNLLTALQKNSLQNLPLSSSLQNGFLDSMKALKNLEQEKLSNDIFAQIHHLFFISNQTSSPEKEIDHILNSLQDDQYYSLLSNKSIQTLIQASKQTISLKPHQAYAYVLDSEKKFFVLHTISAMELLSPSVQLVTYELSNSFCTYLKLQIESSNQALRNKIKLPDYCAQKILEVQTTQSSQNSNSTPDSISTKESFLQDSALKQEDASSDPSSGICKDISENIQFCHKIPKSNLANYLKDGFRLPTLEELEDNFDDSKYFGVHLHTTKSGYYFFNEDLGWEYLNELDYDVSIDLVLIR